MWRWAGRHKLGFSRGTRADYSHWVGTCRRGSSIETIQLTGRSGSNQRDRAIPPRRYQGRRSGLSGSLAYRGTNTDRTRRACSTTKALRFQPRAIHRGVSEGAADITHPLLAPANRTCWAGPEQNLNIVETQRPLHRFRSGGSHLGPKRRSAGSLHVGDHRRRLPLPGVGHRAVDLRLPGKQPRGFHSVDGALGRPGFACGPLLGRAVTNRSPEMPRQNLRFPSLYPPSQ